MKKAYRIKKEREFQHVYHHAQTYANRQLGFMSIRNLNKHIFASDYRLENVSGMLSCAIRSNVISVNPCRI